MGATTPLGGDVQSTWDGLLAGRSGTRPLSEEYARYELPVLSYQELTQEINVQPLARVDL